MILSHIVYTGILFLKSFVPFSSSSGAGSSDDGKLAWYPSFAVGTAGEPQWGSSST